MLDIIRISLPDLFLPPLAQRSDVDRAIALAADAHDATRRRLAVSIAEETREGQRRADLLEHLKDLETRAIIALDNGREDLARRAADVIAAVESEVAASKAASVRFGDQAERARRELETQRRRLFDLDRRRRLARVGAAFESPVADGLDPFACAEAHLARVEARQADAAAVRGALAPASAHSLIDEMSEAGFGRSTHILASDVMKRLHGRTAASKQLPEA